MLRFPNSGNWLAAAVLAGTVSLWMDAAAGIVCPLPDDPKPEDVPRFEQVIAASRASDLNTPAAKALLDHGMALFQAERYAEAVPFIEEGIRRDPSKQWGWQGLGWSYFFLGDVEKTERLWEYFRQLMPNEPMPHSLLAQLAFQRQDWATADRHLRKTLAISPDLFDMRLLFGHNLMRLGEQDEAEKVYRKLIKEEPERLDIQINLAHLLTYKLEYDEAAKLLRNFNAELPGNVRYMLDQADMELRTGELKTADQLCLDVLAIEPNNTRALTLRADIAEISDAVGQDVTRLKKLIEATPDPILRSKLRMRMAVRCTALNKRKPGLYSDDFVLGQIRTAIDENPVDASAQVFYAEACLAAKRTSEGKRWAVNVLEKLNRHNVRAKMVLFEAALAERRFDDADQVLNDRFRYFDPTDPMRYYYEARLFTVRGDYYEALRSLDKMEAAAQQGCVLTLLYNDLTESDWMPVTSVRRFNEHLNALRQAGFTLISPADIPNVIGGGADAPPLFAREEAAPERPDSPPWTARMVDYVRYGVTGDRKFKSEPQKPQDPTRPVKLVSVTFDGGLRSAFLLGSEVADDLGVPFGMFVTTKPEKEYKPAVAGWKEINRHAASGAWILGSQLYEAADEGAVDRDGKDLRKRLPNRLWLPEKERVESMNEWDRRMRNEFRLSRKILSEQLGERDSAVPLVSYPYGDIAQENACNLILLDNPTLSITSEAARKYRVGFVQTQSGFTTAGDNPLLTRRFMPN
ncbi:MAG: tetratricopeptide repeat protein, partial [Verrucomicrobiota bacterium]|nr:tetratricopeptide repeat protein [Verrucomicrobiota bacterium]